jgi:hypothetical protein
MKKDWKKMLDPSKSLNDTEKKGIAKYAYNPEVLAWQANQSQPTGFSLEQVAALVMVRT